MAVSAKTRKAQFGREGTPGTPVSATELWRGLAVIEDTRQMERVEEDVGIFGGYGRVETVALGAQVNMEGQPATFQQLPHIFEAGIKSVTAVPVGATYTRTYAIVSATANAIKTYTWEFGDATEAEEAEYCFVESFELAGAVNEMLQLSATWRGRQVTQASFTTSMAPIAVSAVLFNTGTLFIDDTSAAVGDSQVSNSFRSFSLSVETGFKAIYTGEGQLYFTFNKMTDPIITMDITAEHDASWSSAGEKGKWRAKTERLIRVQFTGTAPNKLTVDLGGKWETFGVLEEEDGNSVIRGSFFAHYVTSDNLLCNIVVVNSMATP